MDQFKSRYLETELHIPKLLLLNLKHLSLQLAVYRGQNRLLLNWCMETLLRSLGLMNGGNSLMTIYGLGLRFTLRAKGIVQKLMVLRCIA